MLKSIFSVGIGMILLLPTLPVESNSNKERNNLIKDMVERRKKKGKGMEVTMNEFWKELKDTRKIKFGYDPNYEKTVDYCRNWGEMSVRYKDEEWNLQNIVKYSYYCMNTINGMTTQLIKEDFN